ncbi:MAG: hypothetical protein GY850_19395 [bacterium]|nr:hypothetical protein [bacterium]
MGALSKTKKNLGHQAQSLKVGDKVELVPSHGCTTIPLHSWYVLTRGDRIVDLAPIAARGALF